MNDPKQLTTESGALVADNQNWLTAGRIRRRTGEATGH
jgi:hypothetical protein